jgi:hypothetical protein
MPAETVLLFVLQLLIAFAVCLLFLHRLTAVRINNFAKKKQIYVVHEHNP